MDSSHQGVLDESPQLGKRTKGKDFSGLSSAGQKSLSLVQVKSMALL